MGRAPKVDRYKREAQNGSSSGGSSSGRSAPASIPRLDGNRDPAVTRESGTAMGNCNEKDVKNVSEYLGLTGWYKARGVSINRAFHHSQATECMID